MKYEDGWIVQLHDHDNTLSVLFIHGLAEISNNEVISFVVGDSHGTALNVSVYRNKKEAIERAKQYAEYVKNKLEKMCEECK